MGEPIEPAPFDVDVRMRGFSRRATVEQALAWLNAQVGALSAERVPLAEAAGRVLAEPVVSTADVPGFNRAMMDGFAVKAACVAGPRRTTRSCLN